MTNGGIYFIVAKPTNEGETGIARYNDVQIRNCSLDTVNRWGIAVGYTYQWRQFETGELPDATMAKYGSSNVVIENNYLNHVGGDAITTMYLDRPLIQYNVSENAAEQINTKDYSKNQPSLDAMVIQTVHRALVQDAWQLVSGHGNVKMRFSSIMNVLKH